MHPAQKEFCEEVKAKYPKRFTGVKVVDFGSMDINGNNRYLFSDSDYTGVDIGEGPNVDIVCPAHEFKGEGYNVVISTEMLEHDKHYAKSLENMVRILKPGGLLIVSCATEPRREHGTTRTSPKSSPYTNDYYKNIMPTDIFYAIDMRAFYRYNIHVNYMIGDLYFYAIKRTDGKFC